MVIVIRLIGNRKNNVICFVGIDGSGKTTQAELLCNWLLKQHRVKYLHLFSPGITLAGKISSKQKYWFIKNMFETKNKYLFLNFIKFLLILCALLVSSWSDHVFNRIFFYDYVIYDRYYYDRIINNLIEFIFIFPKTVSLLLIYSMILFPKPDHIFLLKINPHEAITRKKEHTLKESIILCNLYTILGKIIDGISIDANQTIEDIHLQIKSRVEN